MYINFVLPAFCEIILILSFAGKKFSRRVLSKCWEGVLDVLSVLLNGKNSCGITSSLALLLGTEGAKEESHRAREAICMSLDGLQKAARLCCTLGIYNMFGPLTIQKPSGQGSHLYESGWPTEGS